MALRRELRMKALKVAEEEVMAAKASNSRVAAVALPPAPVVNVDM